MYFRESTRIGLRRFELSDADFVVALWNDKDYIQHVADRGIRTISDAEKYLTAALLPECTEEGYGAYLVEQKGTHIRMGFVGLFRRPEHLYADIGYAFLPEHRGRGYAFEAAKILEEVARDHLRLPEINSFTSRSNGGSKTILLKLGLKFIRTFKMQGYEGDTDHYSKKF